MAQVALAILVILLLIMLQGDGEEEGYEVTSTVPNPFNTAPTAVTSIGSFGLKKESSDGSETRFTLSTVACDIVDIEEGRPRRIKTRSMVVILRRS